MANKGKKSSGKSEVSDNSGRINRKKRTSFERRCLSKEMKRMYMGAPKSIFKMVLAAETDSRKKVNNNNNNNKDDRK